MTEPWANRPNLTAMRWAVRGALVLGVAASVTANVLHAEPNGIARTIAAWPPLALLVTIELTSRVPLHRPWLTWVRRLGTAAIAGIAAWVSYWHMVAVALRYGEGFASAHLLPLSVDGLIIVTSVCLVELAGRIRAAAPVQVQVRAVEPEPVPELSTEPEPADDPRYPAVRAFVERHVADKGRAPGRHLVAKEVGVGYDATRELIDRAVAELGHGNPNGKAN